MNYKLIDCGTYTWFVKTDRKYHHCIYSITGEYKKIRRSATPSMPSNQKMRFLLILNMNHAKKPLVELTSIK